MEEFDGEVLRLSVVEEDAALLGGGEAHRHVGRRPRVQRLQFHEAGVVAQADGGEVLAPLARVAGRAPTKVLARRLVRLVAHAVLAVVLLTHRRRRVQHRHHRTHLSTDYCLTNHKARQLDNFLQFCEKLRILGRIIFAITFEPDKIGKNFVFCEI